MKNRPNKQLGTLKAIPLWAYALFLVAVIFGLSMIPGGRALPLLLLPIASIALYVWAMRRYKWARVLTIVLVCLFVVLILIGISASRGLHLLGY
jgi:4-hydroxybenzoate polyprenyltransferase